MLKKVISHTLPLICVPGLAFAHAALVKATPGSRAVVSQMPKQIELCFNENVEINFSALAIVDEKQVPASLGELTLGVTPKCLAASIAPAGPGTYSVKYRVLSLDGHVVESSYQFTIKPEPNAP